MAATRAAVRNTRPGTRLASAAPRLCVLALAWAAASCAEELDNGLSVVKVDASFGLARGSAADTSQEPPSDEDDSAPDDTQAGERSETDTASGPSQQAQVDAGPPAKTCKNLRAFTEQVTPLLLERCVRCHDGTKGKATKTLDLTSARDPGTAAQQRSCDQVLKSAPDSSETSPLFAEVNPGNATVHDFKYPSAMAYMDYRAAVLVWLETE